MLYKNLEALEPLKRLVLEANEGLATASRTIDTSSMKELLGAATGAGVGGTVSFVALYCAGTVGLSAVGITSALGAVGGTMLGGMAVLALPIVVLAVGGHAIVSKRNRRRLVQAKEALLQEIEARRDQVLRDLEQRVSLVLSLRVRVARRHLPHQGNQRGHAARCHSGRGIVAGRCVTRARQVIPELSWMSRSCAKVGL